MEIERLGSGAVDRVVTTLSDDWLVEVEVIAAA